MDIMDSTDTPTGGLDRTTASSASTASSSSASALPLSVDQRDDFASPTNRSSYGGQQPTSTDSFSFSSGGSAFDRVDVGNRMAVQSESTLDSMPTSTDDIMMPHMEYASHPSLMGGNSASTTTASASASATNALDATKSKAADAKDQAADMAASAKAKAADMTDSAKSKAADMSDSAKAKAADLKDEASDMLDSTKEKASDVSATVKTKAAEMTSETRRTLVETQKKVEDGAESLKDKVVEGGHKLLDMAKSGLHQAEGSLHSAEKTVEDKYEHTKEKYASGREPHRATAPDIRGQLPKEATDTHPDASSMRDAHLHPGLSSLPSHGNEIHPVKDPKITDVHRSAMAAGEAAHARALANKDQAEGEDVLQKGGFLHRMHDKLEDGAEAVKERVDGFLERNVRVDSDEHLSAVKGNDLPTLIDSSHKHNTDQVRAKMHPSQERTLNGVDDTDDVDAA